MSIHRELNFRHEAVDAAEAASERVVKDNLEFLAGRVVQKLHPCWGRNGHEQRRIVVI